MLRRLPIAPLLSQAITKRALVARSVLSPHRHRELGHSPASSTLHPASRRTMKILAPAYAKPEVHTSGHVVVRYGLVPTAQEPILNRQRMLLQTNGHAAQRMAQSIYSTVLTHTHKGFSYTH